ncbi:MAG: XRE family transcriptional regulator [Nitrospirae bacterium]|nr:MAG: XRE family transcriptional regulator [Nitrospirota bacterium]
MAKLRDFKRLRDNWLKDPAVKREYDALKAEFQIAEEILKARLKAHLTQAELAEKVGTKATAISRLESLNYGKASISMLKKVANALNCDLQVRLVPKTR